MYLAAVLGRPFLKGPLFEMFSSCYFLSEYSEPNSICGTFLSSRFLQKAIYPHLALSNPVHVLWGLAETFTEL